MQCVFRFSVQSATDEAAETARCRLLEQMVGQECEYFRVPAGACEACLKHSAGDAMQQHPVIPSLLLQISEAALAEEARRNELSPQRERRLNEAYNTAIQALTTRTKSAKPAPACDVVLCADRSSDLLKASIQSILDQEDVTPFLHLIDIGNAADTFEKFAGHWNVRLHRLPNGTSPLAAVHALIETLSTMLVALQPAEGISTPDRLAKSIQKLESEGAEITGAATSANPAQATEANTDSKNPMSLDASTLVFRRCTFVDLGGVTGKGDEEVCFVERALKQGRHVVASPEVFIEMPANASRQPSVSVKPREFVQSEYQSQKGQGFPEVPVAVDVVLPFHGHLDYVNEALEGLLNQRRCRIVIHLIDDASPEETSEFLNHWSKQENIRTYRNRENIGQFQSFNNAVRFFETPLCAVQDADDISMPDRLWWAGQVLHYADADVFAATVELFGDDHVIRPIFKMNEKRVLQPRARIRRSFFPIRGEHGYFLENPTAVFRVDAFRMLGGFADFGDRLMNRASVDSEFQQRLLFHGTRFAISHDILVRYRVHPQSATQDTQSGWGTTARTRAGRIMEARASIFERGSFDPRAFGSLGRYQHVTERIH